MDWRALDPLSAEGMLMAAQSAVRASRAWVDVNARVSHVGFRSESQLEWERLQDVVLPMGEVCMTFKPDGRKIPFVKLANPLKIGADVLEYIELPAPKPEPVAEPNVLVVYRIAGETREPMLKGGYEVREQSLHAEDFIERDKGRAL